MHSSDLLIRFQKPFDSVSRSMEQPGKKKQVRTKRKKNLPKNNLRDVSRHITRSLRVNDGKGKWGIEKETN